MISEQQKKMLELLLQDSNVKKHALELLEIKPKKAKQKVSVKINY